MKQFTAIIAIGLQALLFSSCLTTRQMNLLQSPGGSIPAYPQVWEQEEYVIKPGDELNIQVALPGDQETAQLFNLFSGSINGASEEHKLRSLSVAPDGTIYFPYIGVVQVAGKTTSEVQEMIASKINGGFIAKGDCFVYVRLNSRYFSVIGESNVGRYPITKEQLTVYQALAQSKDIRPYGNRAQVKIIRRTVNGTVVKTFDLRSAAVVNSEFYYIQPNDVIYIQPLGRQFLGINSFGAIFVFITTLSSLGVMVYNLTKK